jgi:hypothetical protein
MERLAPRSAACPLSGREVLGAAREAGFAFPLVRAPIAGVARGALVAAKVFQSVLGLVLPAGTPARPWFDAVTRAADEVAVGLPLVLAADLTLAGEAATDIDQTTTDAWRLVDAGLTHMSLDVAAVAPPERGRVVGEMAQAILERGVSLEVVVPLAEGFDTAPRAAALFEEVERRGAAPDAVGMRCPAPADEREARLQALALARVAQALPGIPVVRRGAISARALEVLTGLPILACEDGGLAADFALGLLDVGLAVRDGEAPAGALDRAAEALPPDGMDHLEARAYGETLELIERLGARGSAPRAARALERRLVDS